MFTPQTAEPLTIDTKTYMNAKTGSFTAATIQYTEQVQRASGRAHHSHTANPVSEVNAVARTLTSSAGRRKSPRVASMNGFQGTVIPSPAQMYVQALYNYDTDDQTSLSFRQGDVIQVMTQLESGWWDGVINGVRGWFPSNYCALVTSSEGDGGGTRPNSNGNGADVSGESSAEDDYDEAYTEELDSDGNLTDDASQLLIEGTESKKQDQDQAAFWIPQVTPYGRLFYFNTLTGVTKLDLPLETPTSLDETGPRDRTRINVPDHTRPPPELMARGYVRDVDEYDDGNSASEAEVDSLMHASRGSLPRKRRSYLSDGVSPATSMDSFGMSPVIRRQRDSEDAQHSNLPMSTVHQGSSAGPTMGTTTSFTSGGLGHLTAPGIPHYFFDDGRAASPTWDKLVENMRSSVESYRHAINHGRRPEYVRKAEDISDNLRMLLAAGSGSTDNHSGNPSIISTNKALYPHFRDMMSRFSKLVLSSHIAAADWPAPDSHAKCLHEADGVLHGVYGYVEVARQQRGEDIPRLVPGFVAGSHAGGSWQNNNLGDRDPMSSTSFMDQDEYDANNEPTARLDTKLLERMDDLKRMIVSSIRRLNEQLAITDKIITPQRHEVIGNAVCAAGGKVIDFFRPWISTVESINLAPLGTGFQDPQLADFSAQKQQLYDQISVLLISCQAVAGPLGDEWAEVRGDPLEDRLDRVKAVSRQLETLILQVGFSLRLLLEMMPQEGPSPNMTREEHRRTDGGTPYQRTHVRRSSRLMQRPPLADRRYTDGVDPSPVNYRTENSKLEDFFGEVPAPVMPRQEIEVTPPYLKLDHEGEIAYDMKVNPPQLRGGTLTGLVEQLTRHDRLDSPFNNTFLLTYRSFTTASELFEMLVKRFIIQPPFGLTQEDYQKWVDKKQKPIRFRVVNILKSWFDNYWMENNDEAGSHLLSRVYSFAKDSIATTGTPGSGPLMTVVEQRLRGQDTSAKRLVLTLKTSTPVPIMPKNMKKLKFLDIDATEFARQLTIIESRLYGKIKPAECLNKTWQRKVAPDDPEPAANVKALILHSNQLTNWVAEMILTQSDVKKRVVVIKHFVSVADVSYPLPATKHRYLFSQKCRMLNNFSTLTSIISALGTAPIHRLNRTWHQVNARTQSILEHMRRLMGSTKNFGEYRETLHLANPPCIPFFGTDSHRGMNGPIANKGCRRLPDRLDFHRRWHPVRHQEDEPHQLRQARQNGRSDP